MRIPRIAHIVWNHRQVLESNHPMIKNGLRNLIDLNPDWQVTVYTPEDIDNDLRSLLSNADYNTVRNRHFVSQIDLWRLFKMYNEGGLYMDIDKMVNIPLRDIIGENISWVLPTTRDYDFSCDVLLSAPFNPAYQTCYEMYLARVNSGWNDQYFLGPQTYMHAVSHTLLGEIINTDPGIEAFTRLRTRISELPFIKTYREVPFDDMLLYRGNRGSELENIKRDFYAREGIRHWTGDW